MPCTSLHSGDDVQTDVLSVTSRPPAGASAPADTSCVLASLSTLGGLHPASALRGCLSQAPTECRETLRNLMPRYSWSTCCM